jgi:hypothetical protein
MGRVFEGLGERVLIEEGEEETAFGALDAVEQDADAVSDGEAAAGVFADELAGGFAIEEAFAEVGEGGEGDEALDEEVLELDEEAVFGGADDEGVEFVADAVFHEAHFFPFDEFALGVVGVAFGFGGGLGDGGEVGGGEGGVFSGCRKVKGRSRFLHCVIALARGHSGRNDTRWVKSNRRSLRCVIALTRGHFGRDDPGSRFLHCVPALARVDSGRNDTFLLSRRNGGVLGCRFFFA